MPGRERGRLVEEEELGEPSRLHQRRAVPAAELEPAGDPALAVVAPPDAPALVVQTAAVPVDEPARRVGDELAERRDPVLERHAREPRQQAPSTRYARPVRGLPVVVVGAGQAGLAVSRELTKAGVEHVVLERGRVGQTWRRRWDSFCVVTPNWSIRLPDLRRSNTY